MDWDAYRKRKAKGGLKVIGPVVLGWVGGEGRRVDGLRKLGVGSVKVRQRHKRGAAIR
jgi:hypothetical protein